MVEHAKEQYEHHRRPRTWQDILKEVEKARPPEKFKTLEEALAESQSKSVRSIAQKIRHDVYTTGQCDPADMRHVFGDIRKSVSVPARDTLPITITAFGCKL